MSGYTPEQIEALCEVMHDAYEHEARLQWSMPHTCISNPYREETE